MQQEGNSAEEVLQGLRKARGEDHGFATGEVLGSMCTAPHELAREAYAMFLETNLGDPAHFPGAARLEQEVLADLCHMLHAPAGAGARLLTGGTEANLLACYLARQATGKRRIIAPETAHFSFDKAARLLDMELVRTPTIGHRADPEAMAAAGDAALWVGIAGNTELGLVDPIADLAEAADGTWLHVDAAFGGYVLPFLDDAPPFDFEAEGVSSIGLDPHKMGMAPIPAGALALRDGGDWDLAAVQTDYVSTDSQSTLMGTRPGAAGAAVWAVHRALGVEGYRRVVAACMDVTRLIADGLRDAGAELIAEPQLNVVTFRADDPTGLAAALAERGCRLNPVPRLGGLRIVVNPHVNTEAAMRLLAAYKQVHA